MTMKRKNVFVLGLDDHNHEILRRTPTGSRCDFHALSTLEDLRSERLDIEKILADAERTLNGFDGTVDAIVGYWDFPVTLLVPILCAPRGLPSATLESVVRCEHKYWSRLLQSEVVDEYPAFSLVDLNDPAPPAEPGYPFWLKPVKSASSELAFRIENDKDFDEAIESLREGVGKMGHPFEQILQRIDLPSEIAEAGGNSCLAEGALHGLQAAVEGYTYNGEAVVYATLDSVDYPGSPVFLRHQYPSTLPEGVRRRMASVATRVMEKLGLDNSLFSVEFFYDPVEDDLRVLEVNPRHSQTHAPLFELVDGAADHERMLRLGLGEAPVLPEGISGEYPVAAEWYLRRFSDGFVSRVPTPEEIAMVEKTVPGVRIRVVPREGLRLSELWAQDSYSYELAKIVIGGADENEMLAKYERCVEELTFEFEESPAADER
ncbi:ATP-grasp domain-containing protein [Nocardiopsis sp. DSM 44743]|uniref:ATP-grasp domain-containing protein n=1 Tax=Nocardiopsis lambiniae TaxID=3075539 RepID=A0ABU2MB63_9ACTN|nr:ATP-grasp domain-containing protein [Nocardiopsis sp. DSM 44743]MDT0329918.1 ATP-grasp domain-containing protein [Nocardiopsis sp. DSM 44743]